MPSLRKMPVPPAPAPKGKPRAGKTAPGGPKKGAATRLQTGKEARDAEPGLGIAGKRAKGPGAPAKGAWEPPRMTWRRDPREHAIVFDTETTGLPNNSSRKLSDQPFIIEFGAHRFDTTTGEVVDTLNFLANPGFELDPNIIRITGITNEDLKGIPPFAANFGQLQEFFLGVTTVIGHNVWFDLDLLGYELGRMNAVRKFPWAPKQIDTVEASYHIKGHRLKLIELYSHLFDGETFLAHRAMPDVNACMRCYLELNRLARKGK